MSVLMFKEKACSTEIDPAYVEERDHPACNKHTNDFDVVIVGWDSLLKCLILAQ